MSQRDRHEVSSATDTRWSRVTPARGGYFLRYGIRGGSPDTTAASMCFFFSEREAHRAARWWELYEVEPQSSPTLQGLQPVDLQLDAAAEQLEACRP